MKVKNFSQFVNENNGFYSNYLKAYIGKSIKNIFPNDNLEPDSVEIELNNNKSMIISAYANEKHSSANLSIDKSYLKHIGKKIKYVFKEDIMNGESLTIEFTDNTYMEIGSYSNEPHSSSGISIE